MNDVTDLVERYIALWNETDSSQRRRLIAETFSDGASFVDPLMAVEGHAAIDSMVEAIQQRFPGHRSPRRGRGQSPRPRPLLLGIVPGGRCRHRQGHRFCHGRRMRMSAVTGFIDQMPA